MSWGWTCAATVVGGEEDIRLTTGPLLCVSRNFGVAFLHSLSLLIE